MIYRSWTANSFQRFVDRLRIVFQIAERQIRRIAETVVPFPVFRLRLHGIDGEQVGMRELQTIVVHAWLACDDEQRSRVQLRCTQSTYDLRYEKKTSDANDFGVLRRAAKSSSVTVAIRRKPRRAMGKHAFRAHARRTPFSPDFRFMQ